jgi:outer membrane protein assembly factor BamB
MKPSVVLIAWIGFEFCSMFCDLARADDWLHWRGPTSDNHAQAKATVPTRWNVSTGENIVWKTMVPGRGHSTPAVTEKFIFVTTARVEDQTQSLIKVNRKSGEIMAQWPLHTGTLPPAIHPNNSHASPSPAVVGNEVLVSFHTNDSIVLSKVTFDGKVIWQKQVAPFEPAAFQFGYGASPIVEGDLVIVAAEYDGDASGIYALDLRSGEQRWKIPRPSNLNFASPIVATIGGQRQMIIAGAESVSSYDPQSGKPLWSADAGTEAHCGTVVWDDRRIIFSGGNPEAKTWCVSGDGSEKILWENNTLAYEQSLLTIPNYVFNVADSGVAHCWQTRSGKEMWKERLFERGVSASPLLVGENVIAANERGSVVIFSASPDRFVKIAENQTGDSIFASPVAVDNRLYVRTGVGTGDERREYLIAIGQ